LKFLIFEPSKAQVDSEEHHISVRSGEEREEYRRKTNFLIQAFYEAYHKLIKLSVDDPRFYPLLYPLLSLCSIPLLTYFWQGQPLLNLGRLTDYLFIGINIIGGLAGIFPEMFLILKKKNISKSETIHDFAGHHPQCERYVNHVIPLKGHILCAGCAGLTIGALFSILTSLYYLIMGWGYNVTPTFWIGFLLVAAGILQHLIDFDNPIIHSLLNIIFVFGDALLRIGLRLLNGGSILDFYYLFLTLYWIDSRIKLSEIDHILVCASCVKEGCSNRLNK
jgi:hypothetical protein